MRRLLAAALVALVPGFGMAQLLGGQDSGEGKPIKIEAERGIEWHQNEKAYVARGNALAARGDVSVRAEVLTAYYRPRPGGSGDITGTDRVMPMTPEGPLFPRYARGGVSIRFGRPLSAADLDPATPRRERAHALTEKLYAAVVNLLPEEYLAAPGESTGPAWGRSEE